MKRLFGSSTLFLSVCGLVLAACATTPANNPASSPTGETSLQLPKVEGNGGESGSWNPQWVRPEKPSLDVKEHVLDNGLRVLLLKHGTVPLVASYVFYGVGSAHEGTGDTGMAHFLEHMMFKGSLLYRKGEVDVATTRAGGSNNAYTTYDTTAYHFALPSSAIDVALDIEAERMSTLALEDHEFKAEKKVVQSETDQWNDTPTDRFSNDMWRARFGDSHPYAHPVLGWRGDIELTDVVRMRKFWETWYSPSNATLVLVGDIDPEATLKKVKEKFGHIPASRFARPDIKASEHRPMARREVVRLGDVKTTRFAVALPSWRALDPRNPARDVLGSVLTSGENSRLYQRLVKQEKLCDRVGAWNYGIRFGGIFELDISLLPNAGPEQRKRVQEIVFEELRKLAAEPPRQDEVDRGIRGAEVSHVFEQESVMTLADRLGYYQAVWGDWRYYNIDIESTKRVTPQDVMNSVREWDLEREAVIGWLMPREREPRVEQTPTAPTMPVLDVKETLLGNGLKLLMLPVESGPDVFTLAVRYEAGRRTEPADKNGLTALFGATVGTGTTNRTREQITAIFDANGGSFSAGVNGIDSLVMARDWVQALEVACDVLRNANFPQDQLDIEQQALVAGIKRLKEDNPGLCARAFARAVYGPQHPFGAGASTVEQMSSFTREQLLAHYRRFVAPNNTRIICTGRFNPREVEAKIGELLGSWQPAKDALDRRSGPLPSVTRAGKIQEFSFENFAEKDIDPASRLVLIDHPTKEQCVVRMGCPGIKRNDPDYHALRVLDTILGSSPQFSDRFSRILRDEHGLAYSVNANMTSSATLEVGAFRASIGTKGDKLPQALMGMRYLIEQIRDKEVSDAELETAKSFLLTSYVFSLEGSANLAGLIDEIDYYGLGWDYLRTYSSRITAVTKADIQRVARKYLSTENMVTVISGPVNADANKDILIGILTCPVSELVLESAEQEGEEPQPNEEEGGK